MASQSTRRERMSKLTPENMTEGQRKAAAELASGPRGEVRGPFNVLLRSPELMSPLQKVGEYLRFRCQLDRRIAEMATLIAARHWTQVYEWNAHHPLALKAGLKPEIAQAIAEGRRPTRHGGRRRDRLRRAHRSAAEQECQRRDLRARHQDSSASRTSSIYSRSRVITRCWRCC